MSEIVNYIFKIALAIGVLVFSAVILHIIAYFVPSLREAMPHFYIFVDWIISMFDAICAKICWLLNRA